MKSSKTNYDFIIVGGGASGLMMAYRMSMDSYFDDKSILILDKEKKSSNDRTWCYWQNNDDEWQDVVHKSWQSIIFKSDLYSAKKNITPYQYKMILSKDFYDKIWNHLEKQSNINFKKTVVENITQLEETAEVITKEETFISKTVFNSILFSKEYQNQLKYPYLQQHFVGFFIKTKTDVFDDSTATFMDFSVAQKGNTRFMYVLPYAKNEALFEYTLFSQDLLAYDEYKREIEKYLADKNINDYEITAKEQGSIPMTSFKFWKNNSKNIIHIGTAGGWSKASTGFTFKNTTKKTAELVSYVKQNKPLKKFHKIDKYWLYDLLLLDILSEKNHLGASIFAKLFQKNKTNKILKFLDEETTFVEEVTIFSKMQIGLFSKALIKRV